MLHSCKIPEKIDGYGAAITACDEEENGELWVGNGEYSSQVNFCPNCGYEAKIKINPSESGTKEKSPV